MHVCGADCACRACGPPAPREVIARIELIDGTREDREFSNREFPGGDLRVSAGNWDHKLADLNC